MIKREGKPKKIETFSDLVRHVSEMDLENTKALVFTDRQGNRYRFVKKETVKQTGKKSEYHQMSIIEVIREVNNG